MEHLRSASASSAQLINSVTNSSTSTLLFHLQSSFNRKTPPLKLSIFSHPSTHHLKIYHNNSSCRLRLQHLPPFSATGEVSPPPPPPARPPSDSNVNNRKFAVVVCSAVTVGLAIANRVLYKLALVPMKEFPFFLAQLTTFGYVFPRTRYYALAWLVSYCENRCPMTQSQMSFSRVDFYSLDMFSVLHCLYILEQSLAKLRIKNDANFFKLGLLS